MHACMQPTQVRGETTLIEYSPQQAGNARDALVKRNKIDAARIETRGLAGSRRLAVDTEGDDKHRNRRVEVHTLEF